jgi:peroxiredoxin
MKYLALVALGVCTCVGPVSAQTNVAPDGLTIYGRAEYDWQLRTATGGTISLEDYRGRVLFINLWATWCAPCRAELASIERLRDALRDTDVAFLMVSPEQPKTVQRFLRRHRYDLPALTEAERMPAAFGFRAVPTTFVVDRAGRIVMRHRGAAVWDQESVETFLRHLAQR